MERSRTKGGQHYGGEQSLAEAEACGGGIKGKTANAE